MSRFEWQQGGRWSPRVGVGHTPGSSYIKVVDQTVGPKQPFGFTGHLFTKPAAAPVEIDVTDKIQEAANQQPASWLRQYLWPWR